MPRKLEDSVTGAAELIFPDDATGDRYRLRELAVYEAEEVRDELGDSDVPKYGDWIPVETGDDDEAWLCAPSELRRRLVEETVETGDWFTVTRLAKDGHRESDPYRAQIDVDRARSETQQALSGDGN